MTISQIPLPSTTLQITPENSGQPVMTTQPVSRRHFVRTVMAASAAVATASLVSRTRSSAAMRTQPPSATDTILGGFDVQSLKEAQAINAHAVRLIVPIVVLQKILPQAQQAQAGHAQWPWSLALMRELHKAGIKTVVTFLWADWGKPMPIPGVKSPQGRQWLHVVREFMDIMGDQLHYVTLDNEPLTFLSAVNWHQSTTGSIPVLEWYSAVAREIHKIRPALPISAPAINILPQVMACNPSSVNWVKTCTGYTRELCAWTNRNSHISALDLHMYVTDVAQMSRQLAFARTLTDKPFLSTEWSQSPVLNDWIKKPLDGHFATQWKQSARQTNADYTLACMQHPVALNQWNDFMATAPLSPTFMQQAWQLMCRNRVLLSAYSGGRQYKIMGHPARAAKYAKYALTMLYANATVVPLHGQWQPNYKLVQWFKAVARQDKA